MNYRQPPAILMLNRNEVRALLRFKDVLSAMERVFRLHGNGRTLSTGLLHIDAEDGEFHVKAGGIHGTTEIRGYFGVKVNGGFFQNPKRHTLPSIQGSILLVDSSTGSPLALMDSLEITGLRTAATTTLAAQLLGQKQARTLTIFGTGRQAHIHLDGMIPVLKPQRTYVVGRELEKAERLAEEVASAHGVAVVPTTDATNAVHSSEIVVTCTASRAPLFRADDVQPGTFIAAVGADSPGKQELDPKLFERCTTVADIRTQCLHAGELQHAGPNHQVCAELGEIVAGKKPGRTQDREIIVFDSTGTALQDVAAAALVYELALVGPSSGRVWFSL